MTDVVKGQTLYEAVEVLYHYAENLAVHIAFDQWMHTANYDPQELTDSHMSTLGITAYETWKAWHSIKHPILKPAVEAIASAALIRLGGTACQTSKEEYQIVEWMREMLWDGLQKDFARSRKNDAAKQTCCGECKTNCTECSEVPAETEKENSAAPARIPPNRRCAFNANVECVKGDCLVCEVFATLHACVITTDDEEEEKNHE